MHSLLETPEDLVWLRETHLRGVPLPGKYQHFAFAVLQGNEDAPYAVNLYVSANPEVWDDYLRVRFVQEPPVYCEYIEMSGVTDAPKRQKVSR